MAGRGERADECLEVLKWVGVGWWRLDEGFEGFHIFLLLHFTQLARVLISGRNESEILFMTHFTFRVRMDWENEVERTRRKNSEQQAKYAKL